MTNEIDTYWNEEDTNLFKSTFPYFQSNSTPRPVQIRAKIHTSEEKYSNVESEIIAIDTPKGTRTYVMIHPYTETPKIVLTIGIPPNGYADTDAIGTVQDTRVEGINQIQIGNTQAWYYPADQTIVLWECYFHSPYRSSTPLPENTNMIELWKNTEKYLHTKFPRAEKITTPFKDPLFTTEEYQAFLNLLGYEPAAKAAYVKLL